MPNKTTILKQIGWCRCAEFASNVNRNFVTSPKTFCIITSAYADLSLKLLVQFQLIVSLTYVGMCCRKVNYWYCYIVDFSISVGIIKCRGEILWFIRNKSLIIFLCGGSTYSNVKDSFSWQINKITSILEIIFIQFALYYYYLIKVFILLKF